MVDSQRAVEAEQLSRASSATRTKVSYDTLPRGGTATSRREASVRVRRATSHWSSQFSVYTATPPALPAAASCGYSTDDRPKKE